MKRGVLIAVPVVLVTLIAGLLVAPGFIDWNSYKTQIQQQIKLTTGYDAELRGDLSIAFLPTPRAFIEDVQIAAPEGSKNDYILRMGRLDAHLAVAPLLGGKVEVASISLVEPQIALQVFKDGKKNWMTPELEKLSSAENSQQSGDFGQSVSLKNVRIEKGAFTYIDESAEKAEPVTVNDVNVTANAQTLKGPFSVDGSFAAMGQTIEIKATTGGLDESQSLAVNAEGSIKPSNIQFEYAGVIGTAAPYSAQGETTLEIESLKDLLGEAANIDTERLKVKGLLTASQDKAEFKNATFELAENRFSGDVAAALSPLKVTGAFKAAEIINLDKFIKKGGKDSGNLSGQLLPQTISMPAPFEAQVSLATPGIIWSNEVYDNVKLLFSKDDKTFAAGFAAAGIPGKGNMDAKAALVFASKSANKDGGETYSDPTLALTVKGKTQNIAQTYEAVSGSAAMAPLNAWKTGAVDANLEIKPNTFVLKDTSVTLGEDVYNVAGSYAASGARPKLVADITAKNIDFDALQAKMGGEKKEGSIADTLKSLSMPFDLTFDLGAETAKLQGKTIKGLRAQGALKENSLSFTNLSAQDYENASFKLSGGVGDLKKLSGIDVTISGQTSDAKGIAALAGMDPKTLPATMDAASINASAKGSADKMAVSADIKALSGSLIAKGDVDDPLGAMAVSGLELQVKHPNLAQAIQLLSPGSARYTSLEKPLDFYAKVNRSGKVYTLDDMKANVAGSPVTGNLSVDTGAAKPTIKGDLTFDTLTIQTSGAGAVRSGPKWSSEPMDSAWANSYEADLSIKANTITYQAWVLSKPTLDIALHGGKLEIKGLDAGLFGGQMNMAAAMQANSSNKGFSAVNGNAKFTSVSAEGLAKALVGSKLIKASGDINMQTQISTAGSSQAALVSALKGDGTLSGKNLVIEGFDLTKFIGALTSGKPLDRLGGLQGAFSGGSTAFDTMDGAYVISQGVVNISKLTLDGQQATVSTAGNVNLPQWTLDTTNTISIKPKATQQAATQQQGAAAAANVKTPPPFTVKVAGSLDNPGQTFGQGLLQNYVNTEINNKLQDVLTKKLGDDKGGLIGGLLGLPQQPAPAPAPVAPAATATTPATGTAPTTATQTAPDEAATLLDAPEGAQTEATPAAGEEAPRLSKEERRKAAKEAEKKEKEEAIQGVLQGILGGQ